MKHWHQYETLERRETKKRLKNMLRFYPEQNKIDVLFEYIKESFLNVENWFFYIKHDK